ncbi:MFS transporter [Paenibacillus sp. 79R4]|uniref:MFS transporter n=1 Tax=Paenibacillus sp. 79R4 TaxID=2212847 RepID=UPI0015BC1405|nr:MFS transporter [Paenibacillus sp. 79R4]NWL88154.1 MFS transporter [Paenibacillus sp. 79R4]
MVSILLIIIYLAFISLGLPDSLIGSAWPVMQSEFGVPVSYAGLITMIIACGTIISSLLSDKLTRRLGTGLVTAISVLLTAAALFGFSISHSFVWLCLWAIPYGLGAGAVDAALNNYVALHYASRHMSWLHCFWGVGAAVSPYIMSYYLTGGYGWNNGYRTIGIIQIILTVILFISLPLWKNRNAENSKEEISSKPLSLQQAVRINGVPLILVAFFSYCALEQTTMLWASSYLVQHRGVDINVAARFASLFFLGITFGRFLSGFIADRLGDKLLIRIGIFTSMAGIIFIALPVTTDVLALIGLIIVGLGCAPTYPAIIHSTPFNFGKENSQAIIGIQMASAYVGTTFMPPLFGFIAAHVSIGLYPLFLIILAILMLFMSEKLNKVVAEREAAKLQPQ